MYEYNFQTIFFYYLLPALIPISLFIIAEIFAWRKRDERQKGIRNQAYKHAFVVFVFVFLILSQADNYMVVMWNYGNAGMISEGAAYMALVFAVSVLIVEQILRGSFFSSESNVGFSILMLITVPYAYFGIKTAIDELHLVSEKPMKELLLHSFAIVIPVAAVCLIIVTAVVKHIVFITQKGRAD